MRLIPSWNTAKVVAVAGCASYLFEKKRDTFNSLVKNSVDGFLIMTVIHTVSGIIWKE